MGDIANSYLMRRVPSRASGGQDFVSIIDVDVGNWHILRRAALLRIYRIYDTFAYIERRPFLHYYQDQWLCTLIDIRITLVVRLPAVGWEVLTLRRDVGNGRDRKSTRLNSSHSGESRMPSSA